MPSDENKPQPVTEAGYYRDEIIGDNTATTNIHGKGKVVYVPELPVPGITVRRKRYEKNCICCLP